MTGSQTPRRSRCRSRRRRRRASRSPRTSSNTAGSRSWLTWPYAVLRIDGASGASAPSQLRSGRRTSTGALSRHCCQSPDRSMRLSRMRSGTSPTCVQNTSSVLAALQHCRVAHVRVEQHRPEFESVESIGRPVELSRHRQSVCHAVVLEDPKVRTPEHLRPRSEIDAVARRCHPSDLCPDALQPVEIHHDLPTGRIDMHVRRGNVRRGDLRQHVVRDRRSTARGSVPRTPPVHPATAPAVRSGSRIAPGAGCRADARATARPARRHRRGGCSCPCGRAKYR